MKEEIKPMFRDVLMSVKKSVFWGERSLHWMAAS
jgi:hypothetical protein